MNNIKSLWILLLFYSFSFSQDYIPKNDGVKAQNNNYIALTNARIHVTPQEIIDNGTLLIKEGKVEQVGTRVKLPGNTVVIDLNKKHIYPSFIDIHSDFGITEPKREDSRNNTPQYDASRSGYYWNDHVMPEKNAIDQYNYDSKKASELLKAGFGVVNSHIQDGIVRGTGVLIALNSQGTDANRILDNCSGQYLSFSKSVTSRQNYPTSLMGSIALLRQLYLDADWYAKGYEKTKDLSLEALNKNKSLVQFFSAGSRANALRADKLGDEYNIQYVILGGGDEYERINAIKETNATFILPLNFPDAYDVENPFLTANLTLKDMKQWNQKPANPKFLVEHNVPFVFTLHDLKSAKEFKEKIMKAIEYGLSEEKALEALTTIPAKILGKSSEIGSLKIGSFANFMITSGSVFDKKTTVYEHWIQGEQTIFEDLNTIDIRGKYEFKLNGTAYNMTLKGELDKLKSEITSDEKTRGSKVSYKDNWVTISMTSKDTVDTKFIRMVTTPDSSKNLTGKASLPNGTEVPFVAVYKDKETGDAEKKEDSTTSQSPTIYPVSYPNNAYGLRTQPKQESIIFKNATVWTNESDGILENTDLLIKNGKIAKIGSNLSNSGAKIIDATGKHITAGIIDEHSHIATAAVNESGHNSSAEVTIEDVLDETDLNIYRNLAGGVTAIQVLHGSANPIGGRSAIIKLKWGETADNLLIQNNDKYIKFALGENVKQSNWGSRETIRFPQSRMGVEQVYLDYFTRAKEYDAIKKSGKPYREDLEMETLAEILNKERFITCHSYVQSEINMLMKVAERFNFKINTFTHILEGYKLADKMKAHGAGGSTFSDWWAYKFEVNDAIPYNASLMHNEGVVVAINSDDAEMSRRLNQEAAKAVKYGNVSEEEALKFITLNPAKLLHLDQRMGSIKVGKDADVVLWTANPLSIYSKAEYTLIEGTIYYSLEQDKALRAQAQKERNELINMMMSEKNKGLKTQPIKKKEKVLFHCDTEGNQI